MKKTFKIEVDCANCAAKMEQAVQKLPGGGERHGQLYDPEDGGGGPGRGLRRADEAGGQGLPQDRAGL